MAFLLGDEAQQFSAVISACLGGDTSKASDL
jgi:hypothetical protein